MDIFVVGRYGYEDVGMPLILLSCLSVAMCGYVGYAWACVQQVVNVVCARCVAIMI